MERERERDPVRAWLFFTFLPTYLPRERERERERETHSTGLARTGTHTRAQALRGRRGLSLSANRFDTGTPHTVVSTKRGTVARGRLHAIALSLTTPTPAERKGYYAHVNKGHIPGSIRFGAPRPHADKRSTRFQRADRAPRPVVELHTLTQRTANVFSSTAFTWDLFTSSHSS